MRWFLPTTFGDIQVEASGAKHCTLLVQEATPEETRALKVLETLAVKKGWLQYNTNLLLPRTTISASLEKVVKELARQLKPGKTLVSAVKFANGKLEEVHTGSFKVDLRPSPAATSPAPPAPSKTTSPPSEPEPSSPAPKAEAKPKAEVPTAGVTVEKPVRGCPAPDFAPATLRARECLTAFLTEEQKADFERYNRFVAVGATTGHRYMVTSRHARGELLRFERTLYDLDEKQPLCVHAWNIPAEEEMLTLGLMVQLPGHERWLRELPEA